MALIGDLKPFFNEFARNLRIISQQACKNAAGGASVTVTNPVGTPVNVSIVPASLPLSVTVTPPVSTVNVTSAGTTSPIPAGFKSIAIVKTSESTDTITIAMSDATSYSMTLQGEVFADAAGDNQTLPTYVLTGIGTYKWHGIK